MDLAELKSLITKARATEIRLTSAQYADLEREITSGAVFPGGLSNELTKIWDIPIVLTDAQNGVRHRPLATDVKVLEAMQERLREERRETAVADLVRIIEDLRAREVR